MQGSWAANEFDGARFHDKRLMRSATEAAELIVLKRGSSFSASVGDRLRQSAGDMFANDRVTPDVILSGHFVATAVRCADCDDDEIIVAQDTVTLNYSGHKTVEGLGPINDQETGKGMFGHSALAMTLAGTPLGLTSVQIWARNEHSRQITDTQRAALPIAEKESNKWIVSQNECIERLASVLESGKSVTIVGDRENDIMEAFCEAKHPNAHLVIRLAQNRRVQTEEAVTTVNKALEAAPDCAEYVLKVPAKPNRPERDAKMRMKYVTLDLLPPAPKRSFLQPQRISVVHTYEVDPPQGQEPIDWKLWSTRLVDNAEEALKTVERYRRRWIIERLHHTLKTGVFNVEKPQFDDFDTLANAIAFYYITAWNVLSLMYLSREDPTAPAEDYIEKQHLIILRHAVKKQIITLLDAVKAIAELAGYANYPKSPLPGIKMIWSGVVKLNDMVVGARLYAELTRLHGEQLDF